jgi:hypothetical protein
MTDTQNTNEANAVGNKLVGEPPTEAAPLAPTPGSAHRKWVVICMDAEEWVSLARHVQNRMAQTVIAAIQRGSPPPWSVSGDGMIWTGEGARPSLDDIDDVITAMKQNTEVSSAG